MKAAIGAIVLAAGLLAGPAMAQEGERDQDTIDAIFARGCGDDRGVDRCDAAVQQRMRDAYGIEDAQTLIDTGTSVRRAMFVDGYGRDVAVVQFLGAPGETPRVEVRTPGAAEGGEPAPLLAPISRTLWNEVRARSRHFDQQLAREVMDEDEAEAGPDAPFTFCLHGWVVVVEAVDAAHVSPTEGAGTGSAARNRDPALPVEPTILPGSVRSDVEGACANGLAVPFAFELAELALAALPQCSTLNPDHFRTTASLLATCQRLEGDRHVAGEAHSLSERLQQALVSDNPEELQRLFVGLRGARANLFRAALGDGDLYLDPPHGTSDDRATIRGRVVYHADDDGGQDEEARIALQLLRQFDEFRIDTFTIVERGPLP